MGQEMKKKEKMSLGIKRSSNKPKAKLSLAVTTLQENLFRLKKFPKYFMSFRYSPDLMKVYKLLIDKPKAWGNNLKYEVDAEEKVHLVFGTDYRNIYTYEVTEDFYLNIGEFKNQEQIAGIDFQKAARQLRAGDTLLVRKDTRDEELKIDIQILTKGLFQDSTEDWKVLIADTQDLGYIRQYIKLVDSDGVNE